MQKTSLNGKAAGSLKNLSGTVSSSNKCSLFRCIQLDKCMDKKCSFQRSQSMDEWIDSEQPQREHLFPEQGTLTDLQQRRERSASRIPADHLQAKRESLIHDLGQIMRVRHASSQTWLKSWQRYRTLRDRELNHIDVFLDNKIQHLPRATALAALERQLPSTDLETVSVSSTTLGGRVITEDDIIAQDIFLGVDTAARKQYTAETVLIKIYQFVPAAVRALQALRPSKQQPYTLQEMYDMFLRDTGNWVLGIDRDSGEYDRQTATSVFSDFVNNGGCKVLWHGIRTADALYPVKKREKKAVMLQPVSWTRTAKGRKMTRHMERRLEVGDSSWKEVAKMPAKKADLFAERSSQWPYDEDSAQQRYSLEAYMRMRESLYW